MILKPLKQLVEFFLISVFLLIPELSYSEQTKIKISSDTITVNPDGVLMASGNVIVKYDQVTLKAEALSFNQKTNSISVKEISEFYDGQEIRFSADKADLDGELSEGIIFVARILLDEAIKIRAEEVRLDNNGISSAKGTSRVTSCEECEDEDPNWYLTASSAQRDFENSNIIYRNVTVRVKGLPVAYLPFLRMPDPSVDRASGFLVPEAALTSNLATGLKLPYFVPLGLSRDILLTPYFSTKTNIINAKIGQIYKIDFNVENFSPIETSGRAIYKVKPDFINKYFVEIDCFCYKKQTLLPNEKSTYSITFYIDPKIISDLKASDIKDINISYTFLNT